MLKDTNLHSGFWSPVGQTAPGRIRNILTQCLFQPTRLFVEEKVILCHIIIN